jgi:hypothetical protein
LPPLASPPMAKSVVPSEASPKSARAGVKVGPDSQAPVDMFKRIVAVELAAELSPNPPTMYRYWPTVWYPLRNTPAGAAAPVDHVLVAMS